MALQPAGNRIPSVRKKVSFAPTAPPIAAQASDSYADLCAAAHYAILARPVSLPCACAPKAPSTKAPTVATRTPPKPDAAPPKAGPEPCSDARAEASLAIRPQTLAAVCECCDGRSEASPPPAAEHTFALEDLIEPFYVASPPPGSPRTALLTTASPVVAYTHTTLTDCHQQAFAERWRATPVDARLAFLCTHGDEFEPLFSRLDFLANPAHQREMPPHMIVPLFRRAMRAAMCDGLVGLQHLVAALPPRQRQQMLRPMRPSKRPAARRPGGNSAKAPPL